MTHHPLVRPFGLFISILGTVQGFTWAILSLLAILVNRAIIKVENKYSYFGSVDFLIYTLYLKGQEGDNTDTSIYIKSDVFLGFTIAYFILSLLWLISSCYLLWALFYSKWSRIRICLLTWTAITSLVTVEDVVLSSFLAKDLDTTIRLYQKTPVAILAQGISAIGIVMTIIARGYILIIVNILSAILVSVLLWIENKKLKPDHNFIYSQSIAAYDENRNSPWNIGRPLTGESQKTDADVNLYPSHRNSLWSMHQHHLKSNNAPQQNHRKESTNNDPNGWFVEVANENTYAKPDNSFVNPMFVNDKGRSEPKQSSPYKDSSRVTEDEEKYASIGRRGRKPLKLSIIPPPNIPPPIPVPDYERNTPPVNPRTPTLRPVLRSNNVY